MNTTECEHSGRLAVVDSETGALLCGGCGVMLVEARGRPDLSWAVGCPMCGVPPLVACVPAVSHRERWAAYGGRYDNGPHG